MYTQGAAHIVILIFILIGNIGLLMTRIWSRGKKERT